MSLNMEENEDRYCLESEPDFNQNYDVGFIINYEDDYYEYMELIKNLREKDSLYVKFKNMFSNLKSLIDNLITNL